jgi:hypothetical protein
LFVTTLPFAGSSTARPAPADEDGLKAAVRRPIGILRQFASVICERSVAKGADRTRFPAGRVLPGFAKSPMSLACCRRCATTRLGRCRYSFAREYWPRSMSHLRSRGLDWLPAFYRGPSVNGFCIPSNSSDGGAAGQRFHLDHRLPYHPWLETEAQWSARAGLTAASNAGNTKNVQISV